MAIDFPNNPALNQLYTSGWSTWMWDGVKWMASMPSGGVYEPVFGGTQYPMYGFLYNKTVGDPGYSAWAGFGAHRWRFGSNPGDEQDAGAIDYRGYVSDALSIVGAGTVAGSRKINLYDNVNVSGNLTVGTTTILGGGGGIVSVGNITATGPLAISGPIGTTGSSAILTFQDRTGTTNWGWYAQAGVARLWNDQSGDRFTVDSGGSINTPGNIRASGNLYLGGAYVFFSGVTAGGPFIFGGTTDFATQLGTGNGAFKWYSNPGAQIMNLDSAGSLSVTGSLTSGQDLYFKDRSGSPTLAWYSTGNITRFYNSGIGDILKIDSVGDFTTNGTINVGSGVIELGQDRGSDGYAYVDFHAQAGTDYDFRIIRNPGANGGASIVQNGSAPLTFVAPSFSFNNPINSQRIWIQGVSGNDSLVIYRSGATAYFTFIPEYAANQALIGYYVPGTGWGSLNLAGSVTLGNIYTGDIHCNNVFTGNYICMAGNTDGGHGPTIYADPTNFVFKMGTGNGTYYFANNAGTGTAGIDAAGNIWGSGTVNSRQFIATLNPQYRLINANDPRYGSMWYNDGSTTYLLLTALNDAYGTWNGLRPYVADNATGNVSFGQTVTFNGLPQVNYGQIDLLNCNTLGLNIYHNSTGNWLHVFDDGNAHLESDTRIWMNSGSGADVWMSALTTGGGGANIGGGMSVAGYSYLNGGARVYNGGSDPGRVLAPNNCHARWMYEVSGTRIWSAGVVAWGNWYLADETAGAVRIELDLNGRCIFYSDVSMPNNAYLWFRDTNGTVRYGLILANDNQYYISDGNLNVIVRAPNIYLQGFVQGNGNIQAAGSLGANGIWFGNNGGWWWTGSPIHTDSAIQCADFYVGGCRFYNNGGWAYFDQSLQANSLYSRNDISSAASITAGNGLIANGGGWSVYAPYGGIYSPNEVHGGLVTSGGDIRLGGSVTCSGWYYGGGNGGAQIRCWAGDWGAMSYAMSGGYFEVSPDQGASGYVLQPVTAWSDARLKLNIRDSEIDALAVLGAIPVRAFEWTERGRKFLPNIGPVLCGVVAQEIEELIPNAVEAVGLLGEGMLRIVSDHLDAYYIRAFQQLLARIEELENLVLNPSERNLA